MRCCGDGVNVAAQGEGIAEPGGICISSSAYDQVRGKVDVEFADLGEKSLKNIARPDRTYAVMRYGLRGRFEIGCQACSSSKSALASFKSSVSKPSVNQP